MDLIKAGEKRFLDLNEMEELRNNAYINSKVAKQRMKKWHDQLISNKEFQEGQKVLMYDTRLHIFPGKLKSRWIGPFVIHRVYSNGVVDLLNSNGKDSFRVNGYRLKPFMEWKKFQGIERKKIGSKLEPKQSKNRGKTELCEISQGEGNFCEMAFCCQTIPQHCRSLCECISPAKVDLAHECHFAVGIHFAAAKPLRNGKATVTSISQLRNSLRSCCENGKLLRNWRFVAKLKLTPGLPPFVFFQATPSVLRSSSPFSTPAKDRYPKWHEREGKVFIPSNRKRSLRKEPSPGSVPEPAPKPSPSRPNPPVKPAPPKPPARRYLTKVRGQPLKKKPGLRALNQLI
ncbi:hypothetical protein CK203_063895 [Vitis vinifera]|uniref:Uncharacterized protein n=1 Tax=Vitis vinifera TaxID=29760 RepID=A0A438G4I5_VITVI|nr:hypothetical protein CK203_063895 [Vitis vinifera]